MKVKKMMRRASMITLVLIAFFVTVTTISNVSLSDIEKWVEKTSLFTAAKAGSPASYKQISLQEKKLNYIQQDKRYISSEQISGPSSIEEAVDFSKYPMATVVATGYTAGVESTGKTPDHPEYSITFSGVQVKRDLYSTIAADLNVYPIGTVMYIPGYGYGVVADKGSAINGNKIDLFYDSVEDVYSQWGKKKLDVYILEEGDGSLTEETLNKLNENEALQVFRQQFIQE
ncbi:3D domain-containing protein [Virgibacillus halodenitrificans]|uniref:3D domain-containing protein n=1 Tax=Virgibacillus halodenitrificans TaxID=1482 RepID=UPI00045C61AC|nr:3D domain-containing protein [Virgibacillus halodenitrificans]CDQ30693.1 Cell wall-binding protein YocH precursor [Virgibacillus halodenitrificans]